MTAETKMLDWLEAQRSLLMATLFSLLALALRWAFMQFRSEDMTLYYIEWLRHLHENGHFAAIPSLKSDYTVAFQYLLALVSYLPFPDVIRVKMITLPFDFGNAILIMLMVRKIGNFDRHNLIPWLAYAFTLFLPTFWVNSAIWGQCDAIYSFFSLLALWLFMQGKYRYTFISFGVALSFKLQAIFLLPLLGFLYLKTRRFSMLQFLWLPLVYLAFYLPALALGKPMNELFAAFGDQVTQFKAMRLLFPSIWQILPDDYELFQLPSLMITAFAFLILYAWLWQRKQFSVSPGNLVALAMFSIMIATYFLPAMHERYMYTAELLAVVYLFSRPQRWYLALAIWVLGFSGYTIYLWHYGPILPFNILALLYAAVLAMGVLDFTRDDGLLLKPGNKGGSQQRAAG